VKQVLTILFPALLAGCASATDWTKEPLPVTVSAANYSQGSEEQIYTAVHDTTNKHPAEPAFVVPDRPLFYGFVPGDIYDSNVPLETVYRELAVGLAHRGYFNVVYQANAGYFPKRVDYLLRVHCGVRRWKTPIVRTDKVTWGDDSMISSRRDSRSVLLHGEGSAIDPRAGQDREHGRPPAGDEQDHRWGARGQRRVLDRQQWRRKHARLLPRRRRGVQVR
jgi:hypothetical protein